MRMAKVKKKTKRKSKSKSVKKEKDTMDDKLRLELEKLGHEANKVFVETEDNPDNWKQYPKIVVCSLDPQKYIYPVILKLEVSNVVRLESLNNYVSTILRICELFTWCMDIRLKRKRQSMNTRTGKILITNEYILEKIPACRNV